MERGNQVAIVRDGEANWLYVDAERVCRVDGAIGDYVQRVEFEFDLALMREQMGAK